MNEATLINAGIGVLANGTWFFCDRLTWLDFGWIVVAVFTGFIGLLGYLITRGKYES